VSTCVGVKLRLTAKEFDLLSFLVANRGRVYSAEALFEAGAVLSECLVVA
jgi:DNA-binding response OmpR family regulator